MLQTAVGAPYAKHSPQPIGPSSVAHAHQDLLGQTHGEGEALSRTGMASGIARTSVIFVPARPAASIALRTLPLPPGARERSAQDAGADLPAVLPATPTSITCVMPVATTGWMRGA